MADSPLPSNPFERALVRLTNALSSVTTESRSQRELLHVLADRIRQLADDEREERQLLRDILRIINSQGTTVALTGAAVADIKKEWTPTSGHRLATTAELEAIPEGVGGRGVAFSWSTIAGGTVRLSKRIGPWAIGGGALADILHHAWVWLHG